MVFPPFVEYGSRTDYKRHYEQTYCRGVIHTFDHIRVYFCPQRFGHAFYESSDKSGNKDVFSRERAKRIDWIGAVLEYDEAELYQGWNKDDKVYTPDRRVSLVVDDYVVVIRLSLKNDNSLKGEFVTAYVADQSAAKIKKSPLWTLEACLNELKKENRR